MPDKDALAAYRTAVAERTADWRKTQRRLGDWKLDRGQSLKRPPRGFDADHPAIEDIKLKWFILSQTTEDENFLSDDAIEEIAAKFRQSKPFLKIPSRRPQSRVLTTSRRRRLRNIRNRVQLFCHFRIDLFNRHVLNQLMKIPFRHTIVEVKLVEICIEEWFKHEFTSFEIGAQL